MATQQIEVHSQVHGHRCKACFRNGVTVVWVHDNTNAGTDDCVKVAASHTCPRCGSKEWEKWLLPVGKLPAEMPKQQFVRFVSLEQVVMILNAAFWIGAILALVAMVLIVYKNKNKGGGGGMASV